MLLLPRDKWGKLAEGEQLPDGVEVDGQGRRVIPRDKQMSFTQAFARAKKSQGVDRDQAQQHWEQYLAKNPQLVRLIERNKSREARRRARSAKRKSGYE